MFHEIYHMVLSYTKRYYENSRILFLNMIDGKYTVWNVLLILPRVKIYSIKKGKNRIKV